MNGDEMIDLVLKQSLDASYDMEYMSHIDDINVDVIYDVDITSHHSSPQNLLLHKINHHNLPKMNVNGVIQPINGVNLQKNGVNQQKNGVQVMKRNHK